jgi:antirestriction protein ArdC
MNRLDRDLSGQFGSAAYVMEECTVELLSAIDLGRPQLSVEPRPDHARYIAFWPECCAPTGAIFTEASKAQQITDWTHARQANAHGYDVRGVA